jgi:hypothetical protein
MLNIIFCTGHADFIYPECNERRFWVVNMAMRWRKPPCIKKAHPDPYDAGVTIGPEFDHHRLSRRTADGPLTKINGRWLTPVWASRIQYVVRDRREPPQKRVQRKRDRVLDVMAMRARMHRYIDVPF